MKYKPEIIKLKQTSNTDLKKMVETMTLQEIAKHYGLWVSEICFDIKKRGLFTIKKKIEYVAFSEPSVSFNENEDEYGKNNEWMKSDIREFIINHKKYTI